MEQKRACCCLDVPDEWVIGSFLMSQLGESVSRFEGVYVMGQIFVSVRRKCCGASVGHAKRLSRSEFRRMYREAWEDINMCCQR